jgi:hypothetical protein
MATNVGSAPRLFSEVNRATRVDAPFLCIIGYASLTFPGWNDVCNRAAQDCLYQAPSTSNDLSYNRHQFDDDAKHLTPEMYDRHVQAFAMRCLASTLTGMRSFRALVVPVLDLKVGADGQMTLSGLSLDFQRWIKTCCMFNSEIRQISMSSSLPRFGLFVVFSRPP